MSRFPKQFLFGLLFLVVFGGVGFGIYHFTRHVPTCFDKVQNQGEEGTDCGPVCGNVCLSALKPIEVRNSYLFTVNQEPAGKFDYDALFRVTNPNTQLGSSQVSFELSIFDSQNQLLLAKNGSFYILPGQTKYVYETKLQTSSLGQRAELKITDVDWKKISTLLSDQVKFVAKSKDFSTGKQPGVYAQVNGTIFNLSDFDVDKIDIVAILFKAGRPIGAGRTDLRTFLSKTYRFYQVIWATPIQTPDRVEVEVNTNAFEDSIFLRKYGVPEKFQQP